MHEIVTSPCGLSVVNDLLSNVHGGLLSSNSGLYELHLQVAVFGGVVVVDVYGHVNP